MRALFLLILCTYLFSCNSTHEDQYHSTLDLSKDTILTLSDSSILCKEEPVKSALNFLNWFQTEFGNKKEIILIDYKRTNTSLIESNCNAFFSKIATSHLVTDNFLKCARESFGFWANTFKNEKTDTILTAAEGFKLITNSSLPDSSKIHGIPFTIYSSFNNRRFCEHVFDNES